MKKDLLAAAVINAYDMTHDAVQKLDQPALKRKPNLERTKRRKRAKQARRHQRRK